MKQDSLDTEQEAEEDYLVGLEKNCSYCYGTGTISCECPHCNGTGKKQHKKTIEPDDGVELDREKDEHKERSGRVW